jgi:hypothetical protein
MKNEHWYDELVSNSIKRLNEILEYDDNKGLFFLIEKIHFSKGHDYRQELYNILFYYSNFDSDKYRIIERKDFSYVVGMIDFINEIWWNIDDDGQLYFLEITTKRKVEFNNETIISKNYTFSSRFIGCESEIIKDFCKNGNYMFNDYSIRNICVNYDKLIEILCEILNEENWIDGKFDEEKAYSKYF